MGGTPTLPTASTPGFGVFDGKVGCDCVIEFLTAAEQLGLARGLIKQSLDVVQLSGNAAASAGVHLPGSCFDVKQFTPDWVRLFREMGAAFFPRTGPDWVGNEHGHGGITCPHDENSAYQMVAYKRGYNGLGKPATGPYAGQWGYGGKDTFWRPATFRTRAQGIAWANSEIARLTKETDVNLTDQVPLNKNIEGVTYSRPTETVGNILTGSYGYTLQVRNKVDAVYAAVLALASALGPEVEAAVKKAMADAVVNVEVNFPPNPPATP